MKLFSAAQIKDWDAYTILHEPILSIHLMERAAEAVVAWLDQHNYHSPCFRIFCGRGNNGGDGLAIARLLVNQSNNVLVYVLAGDKQSDDFVMNQARLQAVGVNVRTIHSVDDFPLIAGDDVIVECLFGTGLNKAISGMIEQLIDYINQLPNEVVAVDLPAGMFADQPSSGNPCIYATHTLTFQTPKLALLLPENSSYAGNVHVLDIGLSTKFADETTTDFELIDLQLASNIYTPSKPFAHKGDHGHALIMAGSYGKMGAAVMAAAACLRTGAGLLTCHAPANGNDILQTTVLEAMVIADEHQLILSNLPPDLDKYVAVCIGPGIGTAPETTTLLQRLLETYERPILVDADALNIISQHQHLLDSLPAQSILTPHPKEFERLFGKSENDFDRLEQALKHAAKHHCIIVLKGHHTFIALPGGSGYFNTTGNAGMAKGGSGDVLSGIITGLLARRYSPANAAILGVFLHGLAGDLAAETYGQESMLPTDLIQHIGQAYKHIAEEKMKKA